MTYVLDEHTLNTLKLALLFYANGKNIQVIRNDRKIPINFEEERNRLKSSGYRYNNQWYDGSEEYVEEGVVAQKALDMLDNIVYDADHQQYSEAVDDQQAQTQGKTTDPQTT